MPMLRSPATLSKALCRPCLVYPLASLDVSGQRPVSCADASPNEVFACDVSTKPMIANPALPCQGFSLTYLKTPAGVHLHI